MWLWMLTDDEFPQVASDAGWSVADERGHGMWRVRLLH
jgi:hypothetical protein